MEINPFFQIFKENSKGELTSHLISTQFISNFFDYLLDNLNNEKPSPTIEDKVKVISNFCRIIKENRTIVELFSSYQDKSIYLYLFDLYLNKYSSIELKKEIIILLDELRINIQSNKKIFEYLFENLSSIYRENNIDNEQYFKDILTLLNTILGETENYIKPRNYFACNGPGQIIFETPKDKKIKIGEGIILILNFFIKSNSKYEETNLCNLIKIKLEKEYLEIHLDYKNSSLMLKDKIIDKLPINEWICLLLFIYPNTSQKLELNFYINADIKAEKKEIVDDIEWNPLKEINAIEFFDNFYGELSSIVMFSKKEQNSSLFKSEEFFEIFKNNTMGIWKKKNYSEFINHISKFKYSIIQTNLKKESSKKLIKINQKKESGNFEESQKTLKDDLIFVMSSFNNINTCPNILEDCLGKNHALFFGNIKSHKYICYQNKIDSLFSLTNLLPIAEMFLIHPKLLTETTFELFLKIIENILNYRKNNIKSAKRYRFFKILSLFIEKYPNYLFTEKILDGFINIGKTIFKNDSESLCKSYFKHILLNEKILSKYNSNFQIKFWNYIHLFCQSDNTQIGNFINMNRLSLLLRFYDREKYNEMCCKEHLGMFKENYLINKTVMNPPLNKKLLYMKDVLNDIIHFQEPVDSFYLFKLLELDLSPCLIKFILNIFKIALDSHKDDKEWKNKFIKVLIKNKYEVIIINTFIHSLPDIRLDILEIIYNLDSKMIEKEQKEYIRQCQMMIKPFLLPTEIFYVNDENDFNNDNEKKEEMKNEIIIIKDEDNNNNDNKPNIEKPKKIFVIKEPEEDKIKGTLIIKDDLYQKYIEKVFSFIILWSLNINVNSELEKIPIDKQLIKNLDIFQHLFEMNKKLKNIDFTSNLIKNLDRLMELEKNSFQALYNTKFMILLIELDFNCYINIVNEENGKKYLQCFNDCKNIIIKIYVNSLNYAPNNEKIKFPSKQLDIILIWCDKILLNENIRNNKNIIYSFTDEIFFDLLTSFKINYETNMEFNIDENDQITTGYFFNNYMILLSKLFQWSFQFRLETLIYKNGLTVIEQEYKDEVSFPNFFMYTMMIDQSFGNKINKAWIDFKYMYEIYHRVKFLWQKQNIYKKYPKREKKMKNKFKKYEKIVDNIILDKSNKNSFKNELKFLFHQLIENDFIIIEPVIKIIQIFMMCMISVYKNKNADNDFLSWVKEFGKLLRFLIISSSNLILKDQIQFYEKVQEGSLYAIVMGICFLRKCLMTSNSCKEEIEKILINIFMLCLFIIKFEINYTNSHKKQRLFASTKFNRNDLSNCALSMLFNKYFLDKNEQNIFNLEYIESILTEQNYYDKLKNLIINQDSPLEECLFKNKQLSDLLNEKYFYLNTFKPLVDFHFNEIEKIKDNINCNYADKLLELLPLYEKELAKYSNNSLEKNLNKKNFYRKIKKSLFSWNGLWSDKSIFFDENNSNKILILYFNMFIKPKFKIRWYYLNYFN